MAEQHHIVRRGREARDDGSIILHAGDLTPTCSDCRQGKLQWAEAGYVPWHRICDHCGSHWDLHPMGLVLLQVPHDEPRDLLPSKREHYSVPAVWLDRVGYVRIDADTLIGSERPSPYDTPRPGRRWVELLELVTDEMIERAIAEQGRTGNVPHVPICWARRARFYWGSR